MAIKTVSGKFKCSYCGKVFPQSEKADNCRQNHDLVYLQLAREDVANLLQFIYFKDERLLNPRVVRILRSVRVSDGVSTLQRTDTGQSKEDVGI